ncbi:hypothetical protein FMV2238Y02_20910 [Streptococcus canis]|uniref:Uncharacterized protein n=1 Tax=Streptococcus canis TaxID=1329 RepID=A0A3P5XS71_STRCB|nr:hypothetical protein FMV2238Y02_20910 [Streptococcus canis]VTT02132.1 Uncharacterised protein [Streptococcus dysgalactiae]
MQLFVKMKPCILWKYLILKVVELMQENLTDEDRLHLKFKTERLINLEKLFINKTKLH